MGGFPAFKSDLPHFRCRSQAGRRVKTAIQRDDNAALERLFVWLVLFPEADEEVTAALSFGNSGIPVAAPSL